jgi:hypothetical protein
MHRGDFAPVSPFRRRNAQIACGLCTSRLDSLSCLAVFLEPQRRSSAETAGEADQMQCALGSVSLPYRNRDCFRVIKEFRVRNGSILQVADNSPETRRRQFARLRVIRPVEAETYCRLPEGQHACALI